MKSAMQLLEAVGQIQDDYIMDAHSEIPKSASPRKRILLIAAVVAALLALAGCAMAIHYVWAESPFSEATSSNPKRCYQIQILDVFEMG